MKYAIKSVIMLLGLGVLVACGNNSKNEAMLDSFSIQEMKIPAEKASVGISAEDRSVLFRPIANFIPTSAVSAVNDDGVRKLIREACIKFKVKDVPAATYLIEEIILKNKGFIVRSAINKERSYLGTVDVSQDSAQVVHYNNLVAHMSLRVPYEQLSVVLDEIAPLAVNIDYRIVEAHDVTVDLMSKQLMQLRNEIMQKRLSNAIVDNGRKLDDILDAEDRMDDLLRQADNAKLAAYRLNDRIAYSTIDINLYQDPIKSSEMILRDNVMTEIQPHFGIKLLDAFYGGWDILGELLLIVIGIWPFLLVVAVVAFFYLKYRRN